VPGHVTYTGLDYPDVSVRDSEGPLTPTLSRGGEREQGVPVATASPLPLRERDRVRGKPQIVRVGI